MVSKSERSSLERKCVHRLCEVLKSHSQILAVSEDVRPGCSSTFRIEWDKITGGNSLRLQPQIDILIEDSRWNYLCGVEVKFYEKTIGNSRFNWPYYAGLDEAIATLNYGFHASALWQVFSSETSLQDLKCYGESFWKHVAMLKLPVDFTMMIDKGNDFDVYNPGPEYLGKLSEIPYHYRLNPLFNQPFQIELRKKIYDWVLKTHRRRYKNSKSSMNKLNI
jgi:hypothetical protein